MFVQIGKCGFNPDHVVDVYFGTQGTRITYDCQDGDGPLTRRFTKDDAKLFLQWWESAECDVQRIV